MTISLVFLALILMIGNVLVAQKEKKPTHTPGFGDEQEELLIEPQKISALKKAVGNANVNADSPKDLEQRISLLSRANHKMEENMKTMRDKVASMERYLLKNNSLEDERDSKLLGLYERLAELEELQKAARHEIRELREKEAIEAKRLDKGASDKAIMEKINSILYAQEKDN